jgi:hypothetical protein
MIYNKRRFALWVIGVLVIGFGEGLRGDEPLEPNSSQISELKQVSASELEKAKRSRQLAEELALRQINDLHDVNLSDAQKAKIRKLAAATYEELKVWHEKGKLNEDQEFMAGNVMKALEAQLTQALKAPNNDGEADVGKLLKDAQDAIKLTPEQLKAIREIKRLKNDLWESVWAGLTDEQQAKYLLHYEQRKKVPVDAANDSKRDVGE